ncbi:MAG TPA: hypothetical protein V6D22_15115 [Candidatus Obscuribacterales bacterium]
MQTFEEPDKLLMRVSQQPLTQSNKIRERLRECESLQDQFNARARKPADLSGRNEYDRSELIQLSESLTKIAELYRCSQSQWLEMQQELMATVDLWHAFFQREPAVTAIVAIAFCEFIDGATERDRCIDRWYQVVAADECAMSFEEIIQIRSRAASDISDLLDMIEVQVLDRYKDARVNAFIQLLRSDRRKAGQSLESERALLSSLEQRAQKNQAMSAETTQSGHSVARGQSLAAKLYAKQATKFQRFIATQNSIVKSETDLYSN